MPTYMYKAMTKTGVVVRNRVEFASKQNLIKTLKSNDLLPISIEQISYSSKKTPKRKKKNITDIQEIMKNVNTTQLNKEKKMTLSTKEKINMYLAKTEKITQRDIVVFTQNFYLLKKANFAFNFFAVFNFVSSTNFCIFSHPLTYYISRNKKLQYLFLIL